MKADFIKWICNAWIVRWLAQKQPLSYRAHDPGSQNWPALFWALCLGRIVMVARTDLLYYWARGQDGRLQPAWSEWPGLTRYVFRRVVKMARDWPALLLGAWSGWPGLTRSLIGHTVKLAGTNCIRWWPRKGKWGTKHRHLGVLIFI